MTKCCMQQYKERPTRAERCKYVELRRISDKICTKKKRKDTNDEIYKLNNNFNRHNLRYAYNLIKGLIAERINPNNHILLGRSEEAGAAEIDGLPIELPRAVVAVSAVLPLCFIHTS